MKSHPQKISSMSMSLPHTCSSTTPASPLKVKLIDICTIENGWRSKQHDVAGANSK
jgi:hypothetical protein